MVHSEAITPGDVTGIGIGVIVALIIIGFLIGMVITAIVVRLLMAGVVVVLALLVWHQRGVVQDKINHQCQTGASFFGIHVDAPADVRAKCANP